MSALQGLDVPNMYLISYNIKKCETKFTLLFVFPQKPWNILVCALNQSAYKNKL